MESMVNKIYNNIYEGKKVLVTGHTGFKGSWLSAWLIHLNAQVFGVSKDIPTEPALFSASHLEKSMKHIKADIRDLSAMRSIIAETQPDFIFHLAAQPIVKTSYDDPVDTMTTNVIGTANILESMRTECLSSCLAVMITSDKCYDNVEWIWGYREHDHLGGKDPYSASKGAAELMIKTYFHSYFKNPESKVKLCAVRAGNVIGGGDWAASRIVPDCVRAWSNGEAVEIRSPNATRPWQHVLEPLSGYLRAGQKLAENPDLNGEAFNFGPNADQNHTVLELLQAIGTHWDFKPDAEKYRIFQQNKFHEAGLLKLNCDKALALLQWKPTLNFEQTASFTAQWYNNYYNSSNFDAKAFTQTQIDSYVAIASNLKHSWTI